MIILGIDPGTATTGYGLIKKTEDKLKLLDYGCIKTSKDLDPADRLSVIFKELKKVVKKEAPNVICVEELFFAANVKTALKVGQARGIVLLAAKESGIPIFEYTPLQVKQAICGYGRAEKVQIQKMVKTLLDLTDIPKPDDAADALAIAICHANSEKLKSLDQRSKRK